METYDLSRLNAGSFERLIRALSFSILGPGGTVYSSGPDGARDFTFEGVIKGYEPQDWNGYLVLQAKFREKLKGVDGDIEWLRTQLSKEMEKFKRSDSGLRCPDYYLVATNVALSGADGKDSRGRNKTGGYTKICQALEIWKAEINIKGFDIWPADKIIDLLAAVPGIRQTYAAWITPGDVLAYAFQTLEARNPEFGSIIRLALKNAVRRDQFARLKDAGSVSDPQIRTSQVFIDLPLIRTPAIEPHLEWEFEEDFEGDFEAELDGDFEDEVVNIRSPRSIGVVRKIVDRAKEKLWDELETPDSETEAERNKGLSRNKIVILGGPGQGKSTASTFIAQIFRAAILEGDASTQFDDNVRTLVPEILDRCDREGIPRALPRRFPVLISLSRFADLISAARSSEREPPSLLVQMASELSKACDQEVDRSDVRRWLAHYPWIIILDGLDEVPPSGERGAVIDAILSLLTEIADRRADALVIVTTRPQGYNHDLDPTLWEHWRLADLPKEKALAYAEALGKARYPDDPDRREDILRSLRDAATKPAMSRLMISPLQVTIMHMIVDTGGSVPTARWSLFNEYFEVLRKREKAKGGYTQKVLERNWAFLGPIHHRAGLALQTDSENAGGAGASMDHERFTKLLEGYLEAQGFDPTEIVERVKELMDVALQRLVLISTHEEGGIRFDVRSLQEFMAAAALTSDDTKIMEDRLIHIAGMSHWRHVFLIAASRCFSEDGFHHRRSAVVNIPRVLETLEPDMTVRNGARLALDMFVDGIGVDHPISRRQLASHALELLWSGPEAYDHRMVLLRENSTAAIVDATIRERIREGGTDAALAAWMLLLALAPFSPSTMLPLAENAWPTDNGLALRLLECCGLPLASEKMVARARKVIISMKPSRLLFRPSSLLMSLRRYKLRQEDRTAKSTPDQAPLTDLDINEIIYLRLPPQSAKKRPNLSIRYDFMSLGDAKRLERLRPLTNEPNAWGPLIGAIDFASNPSRHGLANYLRTMTENHDLGEAKSLVRYLPWPIAELIAFSTNETDLTRFSEIADEGGFGDTASWREAEIRWQKTGVTEVDLLHAPSGLPFDHKIGQVGCPGGDFSIRGAGTKLRNDVLRFARIAEAVTAPRRAADIRESIIFSLFRSTSRFRIGAEADCLLRTMENCRNIPTFAFDVFADSVWEDDKSTERLADLALLSRAQPHARFETKVSTIIEAHNRNPSQRGLLLLIVCWIWLSENKRKSIPNNLHPSSFLLRDDDPPVIQMATQILAAAAYSSRPEPATFARVMCKGLSTHNLLPLIITCLDEDLIPASLRRDYNLSLVYHAQEVSPEHAGQLRELLTRVLDTRRSGLISREIWSDKLKLPADTYASLQRPLGSTG
jgi:hypothetical protein